MTFDTGPLGAKKCKESACPKKTRLYIDVCEPLIGRAKATPSHHLRLRDEEQSDTYECVNAISAVHTPIDTSTKVNADSSSF